MELKHMSFYHINFTIKVRKFYQIILDNFSRLYSIILSWPYFENHTKTSRF